jgi:hypothetical protein
MKIMIEKDKSTRLEVIGLLCIVLTNISDIPDCSADAGMLKLMMLITNKINEM